MRRLSEIEGERGRRNREGFSSSSLLLVLLFPDEREGEGEGERTSEILVCLFCVLQFYLCSLSMFSSLPSLCITYIPTAFTFSLLIPLSLPVTSPFCNFSLSFCCLSLFPSLRLCVGLLNPHPSRSSRRLCLLSISSE